MQGQGLLSHTGRETQVSGHYCRLAAPGPVGGLRFVVLLVPIEGVRLCGFLGGKGMNSWQRTGRREGRSYPCRPSTDPKLHLPLRLWARVCGLWAGYKSFGKSQWTEVFVSVSLRSPAVCAVPLAA